MLVALDLYLEWVKAQLYLNEWVERTGIIREIASVKLPILSDSISHLFQWRGTEKGQLNFGKLRWESSVECVSKERHLGAWDGILSEV